MDTKISFGTILTCIFVVLKLTHYIDWSWWCVFLPVIIEASIAAIIIIGAAILVWRTK